jgi:MFS family permease
MDFRMNAGATAKTTVWELLAERDYRRLLGSQFTGQAADGVAQGLFATELVLDPLAQGTPGRILSLFALTLLPYSVVSPFLGVFVDRWDRRRVLIGTNVARTLLLLTLPLWAWGLPGDLGLMVGILGLLGFGRLFHTTKGAVLPVVLHEHHLVRGNTLSSVGGTLSVLAGGAVGLWVGGWARTGTALAATGLVYLIGAFFARLIQTDLKHPRGEAENLSDALVRVAHELIDGLHAVVTRRPAAFGLASIFGMRTITVLVAIGVILTIKTEFSGTASPGGFALGAAGAGAFVASLAAPALGDRFPKPRLIMGGFAVAGVGMIALGGIGTLPAVLGLMAMLGLGGFISKVAADSQIQEALPDIYRGRGFALYDILYNMASVAAGAIYVLLESAPVRSMLIASGVVTIVVGTGIGAGMRPDERAGAKA